MGMKKAPPFSGGAFPFHSQPKGLSEKGLRHTRHFPVAFSERTEAKLCLYFRRDADCEAVTEERNRGGGRLSDADFLCGFHRRFRGGLFGGGRLFHDRDILARDGWGVKKIIQIE